MLNKRYPDVANLMIRIAAGGLMLTHGYPKLMMLFGDNIQFPDPLGIGVVASLVGAVFSEFVCAALILIGFKTRLAAIPLAFTMFVAAFVVHGSDPFNKKELALIYLIMYLYLVFNGAGKYSVDRA